MKKYYVIKDLSTNQYQYWYEEFKFVDIIQARSYDTKAEAKRAISRLPIGYYEVIKVYKNEDY